MLLQFLILAQIFTEPMRVTITPVSFLWALPISLSIAAVYKAIKMETFTFSLFVREVLLLFLTIIGFLILVALVLWGIAQLAHQMK